jgi:hypothetical protein
VANVKVRLYQSIKVAGKWILRRAPEQRLRQLSIGRYYVRFGNRMEPAGQDPAVALAALRRKQAELTFMAIGGEVNRNESRTDEQKRVKLADAVKEYIADCRDRQGKSGYGLAPRTVEAYEYRLGFLTAFRPDAYLDEIDTAFVRAFRRYLWTPSITSMIRLPKRKSPHSDNCSEKNGRTRRVTVFSSSRVGSWTRRLPIVRRSSVLSSIRTVHQAKDPSGIALRRFFSTNCQVGIWEV